MQLKLHENTLGKYIRRFNESGIIGLTDQRHGPDESSQWLTIDMKTEASSLYNSNPNFSYSEIARIISRKYNRNIDHKSIKRIIQEGETFLKFQKKIRWRTGTLLLSIPILSWILTCHSRQGKNHWTIRIWMEGFRHQYSTQYQSSHNLPLEKAFWRTRHYWTI